MSPAILIIDDEAVQAEGLKKVLQTKHKDYFVESASKEKEILQKIEDIYFNIAIVDLQMNDYEIDGISVIRKILALNPLAQIIIVSGFIPTYEAQITEIFKSGRIAEIIKKDDNDIFIPAIENAVEKIKNDFENNTNLTQKTLETLYADAKNESDNYQKGVKFERFALVLFGQIGFRHIKNRVKDVSGSEVDLIIRNEIDDLFFRKFKPYILIECKNTSTKVDKNQFTIFKDKLFHTNGLANLGFFLTSNYFTEDAYKEAIRSSNKDYKIIFISHQEIAKLIQSYNHLDTIKSIIDLQVKDN